MPYDENDNQLINEGDDHTFLKGQFENVDNTKGVDVL